MLSQPCSYQWTSRGGIIPKLQVSRHLCAEDRHDRTINAYNVYYVKSCTGLSMGTSEETAPLSIFFLTCASP